MSNPKTTVTQQVADLDEAVLAAERRVRDIRDEARKAGVTAVQAKQALEAAERDGVTGKALGDVLAKRNTAVAANNQETWQTRIGGRQVALDQAKRDREAFLETHYEQLMHENEPEANAVTAAVIDIAHQVIEVCRAYDAVATKNHRLTQATPSQRKRRLPSAHLVEEFARQADAFLIQSDAVRPPLPEALILAGELDEPMADGAELVRRAA